MSRDKEHSYMLKITFSRGFDRMMEDDVYLSSTKPVLFVLNTEYTKTAELSK